MQPAFLAILDTALQEGGIRNLDRLIEDSVKTSLIYNTQLYVADTHVIDNLVFRSRCMRSGTGFRNFVKQPFFNRPVFTVGLRKGAKNLLDSLEDFLAIGKTDEEPVHFSCLADDQNKKIMKLHQERKLTLSEFFKISGDRILKAELQDIDQFLSQNDLYVESKQTPEFFRDIVVGNCNKIIDSQPSTEKGKALKRVAEKFDKAAKSQNLYKIPRLKRSYCYRILKAMQDRRDLKYIFKQLVIDNAYNINIAKSSELKLQLHGSIYNQPLDFYIRNNINLKDEFDYTIEKIDRPEYAANLDNLSFSHIAKERI